MKILEKWREFKRHLDENYFICENTKQLYLRAINSFFKAHKKITQGTVIKFLQTHRRIYYLQGLKYYCNYKNIQNIKFPKARLVEAPRKEPVVYPREQIKEMLKKIMPEIERKKYYDLKYILLIFLNTGARYREVLELKYKNINFKENYIIFVTKGDQRRKVFISSEFSQELYNYFNEKGLIGNMFCFYEDYTKAIKNKYEENDRGILLLRQVKRMRFLKELENVDEKIYEIFRRTHGFRRTTVNYLRKKGLDIYDIAQFIGHRSPETTQLYFSQATKEEAIRKGFKVLNSEDIEKSE